MLLSPLRIKDRLFYGWVVVAAFLFIGTMGYGINSSFGVFFKSIAREFGLTRAVTSGVISTTAVCGSMCSTAAGWALDRYGPRMTSLLIGLSVGLGLLLTSQTKALWQLFITYSLLVSVIGAIYITIMGTVSKWFDKKRGLALGIAGSGMGLGMIIIAPFATYVISSFGWRMAYIIIGLIAWLIVIPLSRLLKKDPHEVGALPDGAKLVSSEMGTPEMKKDTQLAGFSLREASGTRNFWCFGAIWLLNAFCYFLVLTHIVPHATDTGIPAMQAATILSLMGGSNIIGRLLMGRISDSIGRKKTAITCALLMTLTMIWLTWSQDLWMFYIFGVVFGFSNGGLDPPIAALVGETFGLRRIGAVMGTLQAAWGIGVAVGPAVGGIIFDVNNSYFIAFLIGALAMLTVALLIALVRRETHRNV